MEGKPSLQLPAHAQPGISTRGCGRPARAAVGAPAARGTADRPAGAQLSRGAAGEEEPGRPRCCGPLGASPGAAGRPCGGVPSHRPPRRAWRAGKPGAGFPALRGGSRPARGASAPPPAPGQTRHRRSPRCSAGRVRAAPAPTPPGAAGHRRTKGRGPPGARGEPRRGRAGRCGGAELPPAPAPRGGAGHTLPAGSAAAPGPAPAAPPAGQPGLSPSLPSPLREAPY